MGKSLFQKERKFSHLYSKSRAPTKKVKKQVENTGIKIKANKGDDASLKP